MVMVFKRKAYDPEERESQRLALSILNAEAVAIEAEGALWGGAKGTPWFDDWAARYGLPWKGIPTDNELNFLESILEERLSLRALLMVGPNHPEFPVPLLTRIGDRHAKNARRIGDSRGLGKGVIDEITWEPWGKLILMKDTETLEGIWLDGQNEKPDLARALAIESVMLKYLTSISRNMAVDLRRSQAKFEAFNANDIDEVPSLVCDSNTESLQSNEIWALLLKVLKDSEEAKLIFRRLIDGASVKELANDHGKSCEAIRKRLSRTTAKLKSSSEFNYLKDGTE